MCFGANTLKRKNLRYWRIPIFCVLRSILDQEKKVLCRFGENACAEA